MLPHELQQPLYPREGECPWAPEPYIGHLCMVNGKFEFSEDALEDPGTKPVLVTEIGLHTFNVWASYYAGGDWEKWHTLMLEQIADAVYLATDNSDTIYCFAAWKGLMFLFGKLDHECVVATRCHEAFTELMARM